MAPKTQRVYVRPVISVDVLHLIGILNVTLISPGQIPKEVSEYCLISRSKIIIFLQSGQTFQHPMGLHNSYKR